MSQAVAIAIGSAFVGTLCLWGAVVQLRTGETWGARGRPGRVYRDTDPGYFWFLFAVRAVLGAVALILGSAALRHLSG